MSARGRERSSRLLGVLAALALVGALGAGYVHGVVSGSDQFADRATNALQAPAVRGLVAQRVTDELVLGHASDLLAARPLIQGVVTAAVGGRAFGDLFRSAVRDLHRAALTRDQDTVTLTVADLGTVAASALDLVRPSLAKQLRVDDRVALFRESLGTVGGPLLRVAAKTRLLEIVLGALALLCAAACVAVAADRRRAISGLGVSVAVAGVLLAVVWQVGLTLVQSTAADGQARAAIGAIWRAFLGDLRLQSWITAALGAVLAAAAGSLVRPVSLGPALAAVARRVAVEPRSRGLQALRASVLVALGALCLLDRGAVLTLVFTAAGIALVYAGIAALLRLVNASAMPTSTSTSTATAHAGERIPGRRIAVAVSAVAVAVGASLGGLLGSGALRANGPAPAPCDGSRLLCHRALPDVALAATHNAMSVPLPGWYGAEQEAPIPAQLQGGIRGLLIDTHYGRRLPNGRVRTDLNGELSGAGLDGISPQAREAAERLRARVGFRGGGRRSIYLCHGFCELGATPLSTALDQIHDFLVAHPEQVIVIVNEDYVTPRDFVAAVDASGLGAMAYEGPTASGRWPTLEQMIDSGRRVVFLAEDHAGAAPWYRLAYRSILEETPYQFTRASQLTDRSTQARSCAANRGPAGGAPLLLVNNWVSTDPVPLARNAAAVNAYGPLLARLRTCERVRHHIPNLVAVNFYREGQVLRAVDTLNGVAADGR